MEKSCRKCHQKLVADPFLILVGNYFSNFFLNLDILKEDYQKALKKILSKPVPFNGQDYEK